jgi:integrase/recombinase XerC
METAPTPMDRRSVRDVALAPLMWKAGLRVSEIVALDVSDVKIQSSQRGVVQVRLGKGRKSRSVPLNAGVIAALKTWLKIRPAEGDALFLRRSNIRLTTRAVQQIVEQVGREAAATGRTHSLADREASEALSALTPHVLRHTCAKRLLDAGAQLTELPPSWATKT